MDTKIQTVDQAILFAIEGNPSKPISPSATPTTDWPLNALKVARDAKKQLVGIDAVRQKKYDKLQRELVRLLSRPAGRSGASSSMSRTSSGPSFWTAVDCPYAVVAPNWNDTLTAAPAGSTEPATVAVDVVTADAAPVTGVLD